jgi:hypothetical protein
MRSAALLLFVFLTPNMRAEEVSITPGKEVIEFKIGSSLVTRYHIGEKVAKPYLWPLMAKGDIPTTRAWPMKEGDAQETKDHVHQKSAWFCHGDIIPEGIELKAKIKGVEGVDFWSEAPNHGKIVCVSVGEPKGNRITTKNEWRTSDGVKIMDEIRTLSLQEVGEGRLIVVEIQLQASVCNLIFADTKEGAFGVRVHDRLRVEGGAGQFQNAEGKLVEPMSYKKTKDGPIWGLKSTWCDYTGKVDGKEVGIAVFDHPKNPSPACWHARGYGLMAANPFGRNHSGFPDQKGKTDLVKLNKGDTLSLRYGIYLHPGDTKSGKVAEGYEAFVK